jgi:hypothetical protein
MDHLGRGKGLVGILIKAGSLQSLEIILPAVFFFQIRIKPEPKNKDQKNQKNDSAAKVVKMTNLIEQKCIL